MQFCTLIDSYLQKKSLLNYDIITLKGEDTDLAISNKNRFYTYYKYFLMPKDNVLLILVVTALGKPFEFGSKKYCIIL